MSISPQLAIEASKQAAQYYESLGTGGKILLAAGTTIVSPVFWIALVIVVLIVSIFVWLYAPCWTRNVKDPSDRDCDGWAPASFFRSLWMTLLVVFIPLFVVMASFLFVVQSSGAKIVNTVMSGKGNGSTILTGLTKRPIIDV